MEKIAVIIPVYNSEKYLARCLDSLKNQNTDVVYRVYIIDDGSTDKSASIAQEYCKKLPYLFTYIFKKNGGQSSARNIGIENSISDYIVFVDSDDYVEPYYLETLYKLCVSNNAQVSMCGVNRVLGNNGMGNRFDSGFSKSFVTDDVDKILLTCSFAPWNKMFDRAVIGDMRFPEGMTYEDFALIPQIINRAKRIAYTHDILYHYYVNPNSTIISASKNKKTDHNIIKAQHILEISELKDKPEILESLYLRRVLSSMAWSLLEYHESKIEVRQLVDEALEKYPNINSNPLIQREPLVKRVFLRLIINKKINIGEYWVSMYCLIRKLYGAVRGH